MLIGLCTFSRIVNEKLIPEKDALEDYPKLKEFLKQKSSCQMFRTMYALCHKVLLGAPDCMEEWLATFDAVCFFIDAFLRFLKFILDGMPHIKQTR